jgi:LDH2 family malate/lactate/ureidoglycolate dehydrogenase
MATSAMAYFGLKIAEQEGNDIPGDVAYGPSGTTTTNPTEALAGAIRVFDRSYKGSHLALMVELLAGSLSGASMTDKEKSRNWGSVVVVIDPSVLGSREEFLERVDQMCARVKASKVLEGHGEIYLPGERGDRLEEANLCRGFVDLSDKTWRSLVALVNNNNNK